MTEPNSTFLGWVEEPTASPYIGEVFRDKRTRQQALEAWARIVDAVDEEIAAGAGGVEAVIALMEREPTNAGNSPNCPDCGGIIIRGSESAWCDQGCGWEVVRPS